MTLTNLNFNPDQKFRKGGWGILAVTSCSGHDANRTLSKSQKTLNVYNISEERSHHVVVMMPTKKGTTQQAQDVYNSWEFNKCPKYTMFPSSVILIS